VARQLQAETPRAAWLRVELHRREAALRRVALRQQAANRTTAAPQPEEALALAVLRKREVVSEPAEAVEELLQASFVTACREP